MTLAPHCVLCSAGVRRSQAEKIEIIHLVEHSELSISKTLEELDVPRSTFYRWYQRYQEEGFDGVADLKPRARQFWNRIPDIVRDQVVQFALEQPDKSARQLAWHITDTERLFHLRIERLPHSEGL